MNAMPSAKILVVDDDPGLLELIGMRLSAAGYDVLSAASGEQALVLFHQERPRAVITDLRMDGMDGHALFDRLHAAAPSIPVIILTAHGTIPDAVAATRRGVFSFLTKPFDGRDLLALVADALSVSPPIAVTEDKQDWRSGLVSASPVMDELLRQARRMADSNDAILICGPRGSGKEALARAVHAASGCGDKAFTIMHCTRQEHQQDDVLQQMLQESHGGTLFLDDVECLDAAMQVRLLPLVREASPFSMLPARSADVRVIAATTQDLDEAMRCGEFRSDLFYSLNKYSLLMPSLAERSEDIPLLVAHFVSQWNREHPELERKLTPEGLGLLCESAWPGNVRQLGNLVEQALHQTVTPMVPVSMLKRLLREDAENSIEAFDEARRAFERDYLVELLKTTAGNVARAARVAQRNRTEFYKLLARHDIDPAVFKNDVG
jgi:two-component system response regulator GlrR